MIPELTDQPVLVYFLLTAVETDNPKKIHFYSYSFRGIFHISLFLKKIQLDEFRSVREENDFDFILHHICWCGHEQSDHKFDILYENISECKIVGCVCSRFSP